MIRRIVHIVMLMCFALLLIGCAREPVPSFDGQPGISLTVRCDNPDLLTKAPDETGEKDGVKAFNENLIKSVDFLFYPGAAPADDVDAVFHIRKELSDDPMQPGSWEATFNLVIKKDVIGTIFTEANDLKATVYALVNFERGYVDDLSQTSAAEIAARRIITDFAQEEENYVQPQFLMDGRTVITYNPDSDPNAVGDIEVTRLASKLTIALNVASRVELKHDESLNEPDEVWTPVPHTMRIYLVWGVKSVLIGGEDPGQEYFSYKSAARSYVKENGTPYLATETVDTGAGEKTYYQTWPMYSYPTHWSSDLPDHSQIDYTQGLPPEGPYFKLEMDWRREPDEHYSYDRRKYYYKVYMPFNELKRNSWYGFYLDVSILGTETDEGKAVLDPTCYLLDWQNKSLAINKYAVISKARYLSLEQSSWDINNMETLTVPFLSSHNVAIILDNVTATRPFYGELKDHPLNKYDTNLHAWVRKKQNEDAYYLDYSNQPAGSEQYEPKNWLRNTSTSIVLEHPLENDYTKADFDYSPYTIELDINHTDLMDDPTSHTYSQYLRHITIVQRPGIYIENIRNRDTEIVERKGDANNPYGYETGSIPWSEYPWGYVYINGGRHVRYDKKEKSVSEDDFFKLTTSNAKRECQWQTVWYTGGSKDMFDIHVTVLPAGSEFVIGDPRETKVNNLDNEQRYPGLYIYTVDGDTGEDRANNVSILATMNSSVVYVGKQSGDSYIFQRTGFNKATALYGDSPRKLQWYYPTEKSTRTENMLAPSYRIASKFGGTEYGGVYFGDITKEFAEYRCAAYQEDGFPAGRWRLPTKAEIHFIAQLSAKKAFERLFSNSTYWSANGAITVSGENVSDSGSSTALLRCVYDSWYWDSVDGYTGDPRQSDPTIFVWGDKER